VPSISNGAQANGLGDRSVSQRHHRPSDAQHQRFYPGTPMRLSITEEKEEENNNINTTVAQLKNEEEKEENEEKEERGGAMVVNEVSQQGVIVLAPPEEQRGVCVCVRVFCVSGVCSSNVGGLYRTS